MAVHATPCSVQSCRDEGCSDEGCSDEGWMHLWGSSLDLDAHLSHVVGRGINQAVQSELSST